jgi:Protein of unknown function (DUF742)/short chain dehydrogenase
MVVVITDASSERGQAIAAAFAADGAHLGLLGPDADGLAEIADVLHSAGVWVQTAAADRAAPEGVQQGISRLLTACGGRVDVLINNAAVQHRQDARTVPDARPPARLSGRTRESWPDPGQVTGWPGSATGGQTTVAKRERHDATRRRAQEDAMTDPPPALTGSTPVDVRSGRRALASGSTEGPKPGRLVRSYMVTGGRTRCEHDDLKPETSVLTSSHGNAAAALLRAERHAIALLCQDALSIAEISTRLRLPLEVVRVLVADMADEELVTVHEAPGARTVP